MKIPIFSITISITSSRAWTISSMKFRRRYPWYPEGIYPHCAPQSAQRDGLQAGGIKAEDSPMRWVTEEPKRIIAFYQRPPKGWRASHIGDRAALKRRTGTTISVWITAMMRKKHSANLSISDMRQAAKFRGGECESQPICSPETCTPPWHGAVPSTIASR